MTHTDLKTKYENEARSALRSEFDIKNEHAIPRLGKIVVNMGTKDYLRDKNRREKLVGDMAAITGQKPRVQPARISVAGFGIRAGMPVGLSVTLRGSRMYTFLDRLITITLPRLRDFRGVPGGSFDKGGNYSLGIADYSVFPEIDIAKVDRPHGVQITIVTSSGGAEQSRRLLELLGMPFEKENN